MDKIIDVSNSMQRPTPRNLGGPVENDIVSYLKKYAKKFNFEFVKSIDEADIIFTNDVFPDFCKNIKKPKIKRMDGIFSRLDLIDRNTSLNNAAAEADSIIFISDFSKQSLLKLYPEINIKKSSVIINAVDPSIFYPIKTKKEKTSVISTANNWQRPEKRGKLITLLAKNFPTIEFKIIGTNNTEHQKIPSNINHLGYIHNYTELNEELNKANAFAYLGFNDPAPKTVCQAMNCQLPSFLTNSGGNQEIAGNHAHYINDNDTDVKFYKEIPEINNEIILKEFNSFINNLEYEKNKAKKYPSEERFNNLLEQYFSVFKNHK